MARYKFLFILVFSFLKINYSIGQGTWEKFYYTWGAEDLVWLDATRTDIKLDTLNNKYLFTGMAHSSGQFLAAYELDSNGVILLRKTFKPGVPLASLKYLKIDPNYILIS